MNENEKRTDKGFSKFSTISSVKVEKGENDWMKQRGKQFALLKSRLKEEDKVKRRWEPKTACKALKETPGGAFILNITKWINKRGKR